MFGISGEHLLIVGAILLIFGPKKLPELGQGLGRAIKNFKEGLAGSDPSQNPSKEKISHGPSHDHSHAEHSVSSDSSKSDTPKT